MGKRSRVIVVNAYGGRNTFRTIQEAAAIAGPGDTVLVKPGVYREHVAIPRGGTESRPLTFRAEKPGTVFVRGSEVWAPAWRKVKGHDGVYTAPLPWHLFTSQSNPFQVKLCVWIRDKKDAARPRDPETLLPYSTDFPAVDMAFYRNSIPGTRPPLRPKLAPADRLTAKWPAAKDRPVGDPTKLLSYSLGQLFHDGRELPQAQTESEVWRVPGSWILTLDGRRLLLHFPLGGRPGDGKLEITVRDRVFAPARRGLEHLVVSGFVFEHCGNQGPFPQNGMVSIRSGSHWLIEHNVIRNAKTIGLDCGNEYWDPKQIAYTVPEDRQDFIPRNVVIRDNLFYDNGLAGISGHQHEDLRIENNVLERNNALSLSNAYECEWEEQGAIKLHAATRTVIAGNLVRHNYEHGIWFDNGYTDSRITRNVVIGNAGSGIYIELGRGPESRGTIDHNIVAASAPFFNFRGAGITINDASGLTVAHNLVLENFGPGLCAAASAGRRECSTGNPLVRASEERIVNNVFIANHGNVELPFPHEHARNNDSDHNVYVNAGGFRFWGNRAPVEELLRFARKKLKGRAELAALKRAALTGEFPLEIWPKITGWEKHSLFLDYTRMTCFLKSQEMALRLRVDSTADLRRAGCPRVKGLDKDFTGQPIHGKRLMPGPFQNLRDGDNYFLLFARDHTIPLMTRSSDE